MLQALIFDFNGIIVDDEPIHFGLFQRVFGEEGIQLTEEAYYARYLGFDDRGAFMTGFNENGRPLDNAKLSELIERKAIYYQDAIRDHVAIFPGVKNLILSISRASLPLAVASGALRHEIETILAGAGLLTYFKAIVSAEDVSRGKPEPEIFLKALAAINERHPGIAIAPTDCLVIEDSREGVHGACRAGMKCLAVTNSHPAELLKEADAVVKSLEGVTLIDLRKLCG